MCFRLQQNDTDASESPCRTKPLCFSAAGDLKPHFNFMFVRLEKLSESKGSATTQHGAEYVGEPSGKLAVINRRGGL